MTTKSWVGMLMGASLSITVWGENLPVQRYAVFVGANNGGPGTQNLQYARKDAERMQAVMRDVGGVEPNHSKLLLDPRPDQISGSIQAMAAQMVDSSVRNARRTEFLFYYSGHSDDQGLLLAGRRYSYSELRAALQAVQSDVKIAILDSCSSGAFARSKGGVAKAPFLSEEASQMKGHAFLTSSSIDEASQESDSLQGSFFTYYLVSGLRGGADRAGDGRITLNEAYEYAFQNTLARTESTIAGPQHPSYDIQLSGTGDLVLSDVKFASAHLRIDRDLRGHLYVRDRAGVLFAEIPTLWPGGNDLALPPGQYTVSVVSDTESLEAPAVLKEGGTLQLSRAQFHTASLELHPTRGSTSPPQTDPQEPGFGLGFLPGFWALAWGTPRMASVSVLVDSTAEVSGVQASGLMAITNQNLNGVQAAGVGSVSGGRVRGVQVAGIFSLAQGGVEGTQASGVLNYAAGADSGYLQAAGLFNIVRGDFAGTQLSSIFNSAQAVDGVQVSSVNVAGYVHGAQIGIVDVNAGIDGVGLGLVLIGPDAYYRPGVLFDTEGKAEGVFQWGMGPLYWSVGLIHSSTWDGSDTSWQQWAGFGYRWKLDSWAWDTDGGWATSYEENTEISGRPYLRSTLAYPIGWFALEAGGMLQFPLSPTEGGPGGLPFQARLFVGVSLR